jgi:phosphatidylinositol glycan class S
MRENEDEARKTLSGIVRLVTKIKEMQLGEGVRGKVLGAVERLERVSLDPDGPAGEGHRVSSGLSDRKIRVHACQVGRELTAQMAHTTDPLQAFLLSRDAVGLANEAFFDPSMMGLLYFVRDGLMLVL